MSVRFPILTAASLAAAISLAGCQWSNERPRPVAPTDLNVRSSDAYAAAVADPARPESDRARDADRKPGELLAFLGVRPGEKVGDFVMGGGYVTRLLAAEVGPKGRVYAFQPAEFIKMFPKYGEDQKAVDAAYDNVIGVTSPFGAPAFPEKLDAIITVQNFHDLYLKPFPTDTAAKAVAALYAALKPGGTLVVVDHAAAEGSGTRDSNSLHRIDRQTVIDALTAAGFRPDGSSELYANAADPRTALVFDPTIRGKTDQFMLRFRKPK